MNTRPTYLAAVCCDTEESAFALPFYEACDTEETSGTTQAVSSIDDSSADLPPFNRQDASFYTPHTGSLLDSSPFLFITSDINVMENDHDIRAVG